MHSALHGLQQAIAMQRYSATDPTRLQREKQLAQGRLGQIEEGWRQNPGRMPGGSGSTGLGAADAHGWSEMLNEQTEHQQLQNTLAGKPLSVIQLERSFPAKRQPQSYLPGASSTTHNDFLKRYRR